MRNYETSKDLETVRFRLYVSVHTFIFIDKVILNHNKDVINFETNKKVVKIYTALFVKFYGKLFGFVFSRCQCELNWDPE